MKRQKLEQNEERQIIIGMITSTDFLQGFEYLYDPGLFQLSFAKVVSKWCMDYYQEFQTAPNETIQAIFEQKTESLDEAIVESIQTFLSSLSNEFERSSTFNFKYTLKRSETYFQKIKLKELQKSIKAFVSNNDLKAAELEILNFNQISIPDSQGLSLFHDTERVKELLQPDHKDELFYFKGAAGNVIPPLCRQQLISFNAPEKRGKSWQLQALSLMSVIRGFNTVHINLEMSERELITRFAQNLTGSPSLSKDEGCLIPVFDCSKNQLGTCNLSQRTSLIALNRKGIPVPFDKAPEKYKACSVCKESRRVEVRRNFDMKTWFRKSKKPLLDPNKATKKLQAMKPYIKGGDLRFLTWPQATKSVKDISNQLQIWEKQDGFIADVVVIDYADLLTPVNNRLEYRHGLNSIWEDLKKLAQERYCGVATATQTDKTTLDKKIKQSSTSEDKRKMSHVNRAIALNQTDEDYRRGIIRWNVLFERNGERFMRDIVVLQCLKIGNPFLDCYVQEYIPEEVKQETKPKQRRR